MLHVFVSLKYIYWTELIYYTEVKEWEWEQVYLDVGDDTVAGPIGVARGPGREAQGLGVHSGSNQGRVYTKLLLVGIMALFLDKS